MWFGSVLLPSSYLKKEVNKMAKRRFMEYGEKPGTMLTLQEQRMFEKENSKRVTSIYTLSQVHEKFIKRCKAQRYSEASIKRHLEILHILELFRADARVSDVDIEFWQDFVIWLEEERDIKPATINSYCKLVKAFFNWLIAEGYVAPFKMKVPGYTKPIKEPYSDDELLRLLQKPDLKKVTFAEYRCWVMINYFLSTGQRLRSVVNIKNRDLDLDNGLVHLKETKNKEEVILPLSDSICDILRDWQKVRGDEPDDYVFCKYDGKQMTKRGVEDAISNYNRKRGVDKTGIHLFRHTYAYRYLMAGGDVFRLQKLLTHKNINITKDYLNLRVDDLKIGYNELNPLDFFYHNVSHVRPKFNMQRTKK